MAERQAEKWALGDIISHVFVLTGLVLSNASEKISRSRRKIKCRMPNGQTFDWKENSEARERKPLLSGMAVPAAVS